MYIEKLPAYIYCDDCPEKHFLTFNRDIQGKWCIAYAEFVQGTAIFPMNDFTSLETAAQVMLVRLADSKERDDARTDG